MINLGSEPTAGAKTALLACVTPMADKTSPSHFGTRRSEFAFETVSSYIAHILNSEFLKERLFGLSNPQGNHGESLKEAHFHLDNTPTVS
jgi:hypothetical protein